MIPKIIHYCWFGDKTIPKQHHNFIQKAKKLMPEYQINIWTDIDLPKQIPYVKNAYQQSHYVNLSNFMRWYILYKHGGIYLT